MGALGRVVGMSGVIILLGWVDEGFDVNGMEFVMFDMSLRPVPFGSFKVADNG